MSHNLLSKTGLQYFWGKLKAFFVKGNAKVFYGTCSTAGATAAKVVTCDSFTSADLAPGTLIIVKFDNVNTAAVADITMSVNGTTACGIRKLDGTSVTTLSAAGEIRAFPTLFICTGTYWIQANTDQDTTYATITTTELNTGTGTGKRVVSASFLRNNFYTESEVDALIAGIGGTPVATSQPAGGMLPNVVYDLGTLTGTVTFSLATPSDNTIANPYHWTFETGSTAPTITWPSGLTWAGGSAPTINASKHYEVMVRNDYATSLEF